MSWKILVKLPQKLYKNKFLCRYLDFTVSTMHSYFRLFINVCITSLVEFLYFYIIINLFIKDLIKRSLNMNVIKPSLCFEYIVAGACKKQ